VVSRYLKLTAERRLEEAAVCLAPGAVLVFPGGARFTGLREMAEAAGRRYRWVRKRIERWDVCPGRDGAAVVYCVGTLHGEDTRGRAFQDVRFLDRFEIAEGRIVRQEVWNDLAEQGVVPAGDAP
jgi:hypothetical protein